MNRRQFLIAPLALAPMLALPAVAAPPWWASYYVKGTYCNYPGSLHMVFLVAPDRRSYGFLTMYPLGSELLADGRAQIEYDGPYHDIEWMQTYFPDELNIRDCEYSQGTEP